MRKIMRTVGWLALAVGLIGIVASAILKYQGFSTKINFGDPAELEFYLVPVWQLGAGAVLLGLVILMISRPDHAER